MPLLVIAGFVGVLVLTTGPDDSTGSARPAITLDDVAADPSRYDGRQLVLSGTVSEAPAAVVNARKGAFVLTGERGRLLVAPSAGSREPKPGSRVDVRAFVRTADGEAGERAGLLADAHAAAVLDAVRIVEAG